MGQGNYLAYAQTKKEQNQLENGKIPLPGKNSLVENGRVIPIARIRVELPIPFLFTVLCCLLCIFLFFSFFHMNNRFMKIVSVVLGGGQMTLCLPTPGTAQYISIVSCSYFQLRCIYIKKNSLTFPSFL